MTSKEEALRIYTKFQVYYWDEVEGYVTDEDKTLRNSINVVNEIIDFVYNIDTHNDIESYQDRQSTLRHLTRVIVELKNI